jgi:hypothetical protein
VLNAAPLVLLRISASPSAIVCNPTITLGRCSYLQRASHVAVPVWEYPLIV